ncbi:hypothetical protein C8A00DRAFT_11846 [Chaetomidium leptoderma]|uniref:Acid phosphatase-like protein n=1 Tax=Chaetomidium leptoderma TaxID=669021 RepID=A0AAN6VTE2_9PEZI|nr:hypothetical protein C8A00DRAFT_11846 [Chaetomidium leptoderma]
MNTANAVVLAVVLLLIAAAAGWIIFTRVRASQLGLPPPPWKSYIPFLNSSSSSSSSYGGPAPAQGGIIGWINDRIRHLRHGKNRTAAGAYEGSSSYNAGYSGAGGGNARDFDQHEDDPWDSRVGGYNPYEEERELGLVPPGGHGQRSSDGDGYQMNLAVTPGISAAGAAAGGGEPEEEERRGRTRSRSPGPSMPTKANPFGDDAEPSNISMRGVSPRPMDTSFAGRKAAKGDEDRKSMFREEV